MATAMRGKIGEDEEDILREHTEDIEGVLEAKDVTPFLFAKGILDLGDRQEIETANTRLDRAKRLLQTIVYRGKDAFSIFIAALRKKGYNTLADQLDKRHLSVQINDGSQMERLEREVRMLKDRIDLLNKHIKEEGVNKSEIQRVYADVHNFGNSLEELKQISIVSRETVSTIVDMQKQLKTKDAELSEARNRISELEKKIWKLEDENTVLKEQMKKQTERVEELEVHISEIDTKVEGLAKKLEAQGIQHNEAMAKVQRSLNELSKRQTPRANRGKRGTTVSRNRFQIK